VAKRRNKHVGSSFDEFLRTDRLYEEVTTLSWKRVLSWEVSEAKPQPA
jgi:antitoxin HicB